MSDKENTVGWDEQRLVSSLKEGHEKAFQILIRQYQPRLYTIAYGILLDREDALEVLQEVFLRVYLKIHSFRGEAGLSTWLYRITVNQSLNLQRKWKRRFKWRHRSLDGDDTGGHGDLESTQDHPETLYRKKELIKAFHENLNALPKESRTVLVLKEIGGLSYDDIARILRIKKGTVSSRLFYARRLLRESMKRRMLEDDTL